jgi:glycosyltransferase involved in cell wall biosynthesis
VRFLGLLSCLARTHAVSVLSFTRPNADQAEVLEEVRDYCDQVITVENDRMSLHGAAKRALQMRSVFSSRSQSRILHQSGAFQAALDRLAAGSRYDIVQVEGCYMAQYTFPREAAVVLDEHNIEYEINRRTAAVTKALPRKVFNYQDYLKLRAEEERSWRTLDACAVTSARDEATVRRSVPNARTAVVPNGVDLDFFSPRGTRSEPKTLLFFGALNYYPNVDAVLYFLREVLPRLRRSHPSLKLIVVGSLPPPAIQRAAGPDVTVTGAVTDVRPYLERASAVVVPLRVGSGTRLKILEAMAMGKAVVSTSVGAEGLSVTDGTDILLADDARSFAAQVSRLLDDEDLAARVGSAAHRLVETSYQWKTSALKLEALYGSALLGRERRSAVRTRGLLGDRAAR